MPYLRNKYAGRRVGRKFSPFRAGRTRVTFPVHLLLCAKRPTSPPPSRCCGSGKRTANLRLGRVAVAVRIRARIVHVRSARVPKRVSAGRTLEILHLDPFGNWIKPTHIWGGRKPRIARRSFLSAYEHSRSLRMTFTTLYGKSHTGRGLKSFVSRSREL